MIIYHRPVSSLMINTYKYSIFMLMKKNQYTSANLKVTKGKKKKEMMCNQFSPLCFITHS